MELLATGVPHAQLARAGAGEQRAVRAEGERGGAAVEPDLPASACVQQDVAAERRRDAVAVRTDGDGGGLGPVRRDQPLVQPAAPVEQRDRGAVGDGQHLAAARHCRDLAAPAIAQQGADAFGALQRRERGAAGLRRIRRPPRLQAEQQPGVEPGLEHRQRGGGERARRGFIVAAPGGEQQEHDREEQRHRDGRRPAAPRRLARRRRLCARLRRSEGRRSSTASRTRSRAPTTRAARHRAAGDRLRRRSRSAPPARARTRIRCGAPAPRSRAAGRDGPSAAA